MKVSGESMVMNTVGLTTYSELKSGILARGSAPAGPGEGPSWTPCLFRAGSQAAQLTKKLNFVEKVTV